MDQTTEKKPKKKNPWRWACLALAIFSGVCLAYRGVIELIALLSVRTSNVESIAVIGGADGPTSILVATRPGPFPWGIYVLLLAMGIIGFLALRKENKK